MATQIGGARIITALEWLHANRRDPNGHYGRLWGRGGFQATALLEWHLNDQASVARSYLHTALAMLTAAALPGDFNNDGNVDAADYVYWRKNFSGDQAKYDAWRSHFGTSLGPGSGLALPSADPLSATVPEPATLATVLIGFIPMTYFRRARGCHKLVDR